MLLGGSFLPLLAPGGSRHPGLVATSPQPVPPSSHGLSFFFFLRFIYLLNLFLTVVGLCCCMKAFSSCNKRGLLCCGARASHFSDFSCGPQALGAWASGVAAHGLSSCGTWASLTHGVWSVPGPGIEPMSLALQGRYLTTGPPGKPPDSSYFLSFQHYFQKFEYRHILVWISLGLSCLSLPSFLNQ